MKLLLGNNISTFCLLCYVFETYIRSEVNLSCCPMSSISSAQLLFSPACGKTTWLRLSSFANLVSVDILVLTNILMPNLLFLKMSENLFSADAFRVDPSYQNFNLLTPSSLPTLLSQCFLFVTLFWEPVTRF